MKLKRLADITISIVFLCTLFPIFYLVIGALIKIETPGPVLFRQRRTGLRGKTFVCLKFRSMVLNEESDSLQSYYSDPRVTRIGRVLRLTHLDELPQFICVLRGDMSIVGPRPHMLLHTRQFAAINPEYDRRHSVRPGITGIAQVLGYCGPVETPRDLNDRLRLDLWYIEHRSARLDALIIFRTFMKIIGISDKGIPGLPISSKAERECSNRV